MARSASRPPRGRRCRTPPASASSRGGWAIAEGEARGRRRRRTSLRRRRRSRRAARGTRCRPTTLTPRRGTRLVPVGSAASDGRRGGASARRVRSLERGHHLLVGLAARPPTPAMSSAAANMEISPAPRRPARRRRRDGSPAHAERPPWRGGRRWSAAPRGARRHVSMPLHIQQAHNSAAAHTERTKLARRWFSAFVNTVELVSACDVSVAKHQGRHAARGSEFSAIDSRDLARLACAEVFFCRAHPLFSSRSVGAIASLIIVRDLTCSHTRSRRGSWAVPSRSGSAGAMDGYPSGRRRDLGSALVQADSRALRAIGPAPAAAAPRRNTRTFKQMEGMARAQYREQAILRRHLRRRRHVAGVGCVRSSSGPCDAAAGAARRRRLLRAAQPRALRERARVPAVRARMLRCHRRHDGAPAAVPDVVPGRRRQEGEPPKRCEMVAAGTLPRGASSRGAFSQHDFHLPRFRRFSLFLPALHARSMSAAARCCRTNVRRLARLAQCRRRGERTHSRLSTSLAPARWRKSSVPWIANRGVAVRRAREGGAADRRARGRRGSRLAERGD